MKHQIIIDIESETPIQEDILECIIEDILESAQKAIDNITNNIKAVKVECNF